MELVHHLRDFHSLRLVTFLADRVLFKFFLLRSNAKFFGIFQKVVEGDYEDDLVLCCLLCLVVK
jgi:hypothetical protein